MKIIIALLLALTFTACNQPSTQPYCAASVVSETCVDHQDVGQCIDTNSKPVVGCQIPAGVDQGVECVDQCPATNPPVCHVEGTTRFAQPVCATGQGCTNTYFSAVTTPDYYAGTYSTWGCTNSSGTCIDQCQP